MDLRVVFLVVACASATSLKLDSLVPPCPLRNSCHHRNVSDPSSDPEASCQCDALCNTYADCCLDAEYWDVTKQKIGQRKEFSCVYLGEETVSSYVKAGCKEGWTDREVEGLCRYDKLTDPLSMIPVTSKTTGFTYHNYYCAICNEDVQDLRMWSGKLSCDLPEDTKFNLNEMVVKYRYLGIFSGNPEERDFRICNLEPERPQDIKHLIRTCSPSPDTQSLIDECRYDWQDEAVALLCHSYKAVVTYDGWKEHMNPHCGICFYGIGNYSCSPVPAKAQINFRSTSFTKFLDFQDPSNIYVDSSTPCSPKQVWDPFFNLCRSIVCPGPFQEYRSGRCDGLPTALALRDPPPVTPFDPTSLIPACPSRNSCHRRKASDPASELPFSCHCDALCNTYGDCCLDAEHRDASKQFIGRNEFWCRSLGDETFMSYIKPHKCKAGWTDKEVEDLCLSFDKVTDPLSNILVTSKTTGFTYLNYYCAICNEDVQDLRMWNGKLSCNLTNDAKVNLYDLVFKDGSWGIFNGSPEEGDFRACNLLPRRPQDVKSLTRTCTPSPFIQCPADWQDEAVAALCLSYTAVVHYGRKEYRNPHCALCNYEHDDFSCLPQEQFKTYVRYNDPRPPFIDFHPMSSGQILDFSSNDLVGSAAAPCSSTQVWDPFFRQCRSIVCPKPHQDYKNGRCEDSVTPFTVAPQMPACPSRNSCQRRDENSTTEPQVNCHCDALCNNYADCCLDAEYRDASKQEKKEYEEFRCDAIGEETITTYSKSRRCKIGWNVEIEEQCGRGRPYDLLSWVPVTSKTTGFTYLNYYCATCNEDIADLRIWNAKIICKVTEGTEINISELVFTDGGFEFGIFYGSPEQEDFRTCKLMPVRPQEVKNLTRSCNPYTFYTVDTCHNDWQDKVVASLCQSYTAPVFFSGQLYRNPHCGLCNYEKVDYFCTTEQIIKEGATFPPGFSFSFGHLLDFNEKCSNEVGFSSRCDCPAGQVWNNPLKRCTTILCPKPGRCVYG